MTEGFIANHRAPQPQTSASKYRIIDARCASQDLPNFQAGEE